MHISEETVTSQRKLPWIMPEERYCTDECVTVALGVDTLEMKALWPVWEWDFGL